MKTTMTFKTDKRLHEAAKRTADKLGIPLTTVVNAQLEDFVRTGTFSVSLIPRPDKVREWEKVSQEFKRHPERFKITDAEDFIESMRK